jgi:hypothetical protein
LSNIAGAEVGERDRAAVRVAADRPRLAGSHDVAGVALVALAEDDLAALEAPGDRDLRDANQVVLGKRREHRNAAEERNCVLAGGRHCVTNTTARAVA